MADDQQLSRRLSFVLRHNPESAGLALDTHGWVDVDELIAAFGATVTYTDIARVVADSDKQRFELDEPHRRIRARQGHTVPVDLDLQPTAPPPSLFHGTAARFVPAILNEGIRRGERHHVHLSPDVATATAVGARRGPATVLTVDTAAMARDGHIFYVTSNGVWLTHAVPSRYVLQAATA